MKDLFAGISLFVVAVVFAGCATMSKQTKQDVSIQSAVSSDDAKAVQGNWKPAKAELAGQPMSDAVLRIISLKLDDGKYEVFVGGEPDRGTYTLDSGTKPKGMTISGTDGPNSGKTFPAIYELEGDTLCICYDLSRRKTPHTVQEHRRHEALSRIVQSQEGVGRFSQ